MPLYAFYVLTEITAWASDYLISYSVGYNDIPVTYLNE